MVVIFMMKKAAKRLTLLLAMLLTVSFLSSCNNSPQQLESDSLCLPNVEWGSSIDDTLAAFDTTREELGDNFVLSGNYGSGHAVMKDCTVFGQKSTDMLLNFYQSEDKGGSLAYVSIHYPKDADMDKVLAEMKSAYGDPEESIEFCEFSSVSLKEYTSDDANQYWGGRLLEDFVSGSDKEALQKYGNFPENSMALKFYLSNPAVMVSWSTNYPNAAIETNAVAGEEKLSDTPNVVILDARVVYDVEAIANPIKASE